jgi:hypothetical protein
METTDHDFFTKRGNSIGGYLQLPCEAHPCRRIRRDTNGFGVKDYV